MAGDGGELLSRFLRPLICGGEVHVGRPLRAADLDALHAASFVADEEALAIMAARTTAASTFWPHAVALTLDPEALALGAALHNILFMRHPATDRRTVGERGRLQVARQTERILQRVAPPAVEEPDALVARHTILAPALRLQRVDVEVEHWLAVNTFRGEAPPPGLLRWPRLRQVQVRETVVRWPTPEELTKGEQRLIEALLGKSPLTRLMTPWLRLPRFDWLALAPYLTQPHVCRAVARRYQEEGLVKVGPPLAEAFWDLVRTRPRSPAPALHLVAQLVIFLFTSVLVAGPAPREPEAVFGRAEHLPGVLVGAARCGLLPDQERFGDAEVRARLGEVIAMYQQRMDAASEERIEALARHLGPPSAGVAA